MRQIFKLVSTRVIFSDDGHMLSQQCIGSFMGLDLSSMTGMSAPYPPEKRAGGGDSGPRWYAECCAVDNPKLGHKSHAKFIDVHSMHMSADGRQFTVSV